MHIVALVIALFFLVKCISDDTPEAASKADENWQKERWMERGKDMVKVKLKDGESARFQGVYFNRGYADTPTTCGMVNGKNSFGAYGGFERFISTGSAELTILESEMSDFQNLWIKMCK